MSSSNTVMTALLETQDRSEVPLLRNIEFESMRGGGGGRTLRGTLRRGRKNAAGLDAALEASVVECASQYRHPWYKLNMSLRWNKVREFLEHEFRHNPDVPEDTFKRMCVEFRSLIQRGLLRSNKDVIYDVERTQITKIPSLRTRIQEREDGVRVFRYFISTGRDKTQRRERGLN